MKDVARGNRAMRKLVATVFCSLLTAAAAAQQAPDIPRFSAAKPGALTPGWKQVPLAWFKNKTDYKLVVHDETVVLRAIAHNAASLLAAPVDFDPHEFPILSWRWEVVQGIPTANTQEQSKEDAPARVIVAFAGDSSQLSLMERATSSFAQSTSGQALPYATLMYVWGAKVAVNSVTASSRSARVQMIAVAAGEDEIGRWHSYTRNLVDDFKRAFGEEPGKVTSILVLTDTDNTGADAAAYYGDISVGPAPR